jgi:hypothetical protein
VNPPHRRPAGIFAQIFRRQFLPDARIFRVKKIFGRHRAGASRGLFRGESELRGNIFEKIRRLARIALMSTQKMAQN